MNNLLYDLLSFMRLYVKKEDNFYCVYDYDTNISYYDTDSLEDLLSYLVEELSYNFGAYHCDFVDKGALNIFDFVGELNER